MPKISVDVNVINKCTLFCQNKFGGILSEKHCINEFYYFQEIKFVVSGTARSKPYLWPIIDTECQVWHKC